MPAAPDKRFARLQTDPRFRRPKQKNLKVEIDERFRDVLESEEFGGKGKGKGAAKVDKRGRPLTTSHHSDQLKHFYRLRSPSPSGEAGFVDYARGEGALESSGSEDEDDESEVDEDELEIGVQKNKQIHVLPDLDESESESDDESHLDVDLSEDDEPSAFPPEGEGEDDEEDEEQYAEPTKRIAAVNLDWDNLRAADLYSVFNSFLRPTISKNGESSKAAGSLLNVKIYPSEFGKGRLEKEEAEGPGGGIFLNKPGDKKGKGKKNDDIIHRGESDDEEVEHSEDGAEEGFESGDEDDDLGFGSDLGEDMEDDLDEEDEDDLEDSEDEDVPPPKKGPKEVDGLEIISDVESNAGEEDIDMSQLRQYQLERLRYYYAVATFSTVDAAMKVLAECNGTEFERTANMFDLTYVPDEMEFEEDDVTDTATKELKGYKGNDFVTDALRHSKVKLTWDQDDPNRTKITRRPLTREEIEEEDFKAYLASSGDEDDDDEDAAEQPAGKKSKKEKKAAAKKRAEKLRALLLSGNDDDGDVWGKAGLSSSTDLGGKKPKANGDMEITFRPGLSTKSAADEENLTSLEKYQLRMKEKKARKKEKFELKKAAKDDDEPAASGTKDEFFGDDDSADEATATNLPQEAEEDEEDVHEDLKGGVEHFSMKDILKAEKEGGKKKRKRTKKSKGGEREIELGKEGWKIDVKDDRFKVLHEEPDFAIDPSNPRFTKSSAMQDMLAERAKRSQKNREAGEKQPSLRPAAGSGEGKDLDALVQSVKRKMGESGKKRKRSRK